MNKSESIVKIASALLKSQREMGNATKESKNPFFKSSYASLNAVREAVTPALNANGITVLQPTVELNGKSYVETLLLHESGEWISGLTEVVAAKINDPQAAGSGISYSRRYGLQSLLSIGAEDDDGEAAMGRNKPTYAPKAALAPTAAPQKTTGPETLPQQAGQVIATETKKSTFRKPQAENTNNGWEN